MDKNEKKERKLKLSEHINLGNGRYKDYEIEKLETLVNDRHNLDGRTKSWDRSYKGFDSEDTYRVDEFETYTFHGDDSNIRINRDFKQRFDDGDTYEEHQVLDTGREILNALPILFGKHYGE